MKKIKSRKQAQQIAEFNSKAIEVESMFNTERSMVLIGTFETPEEAHEFTEAIRFLCAPEITIKAILNRYWFAFKEFLSSLFRPKLRYVIIEKTPEITQFSLPRKSFEKGIKIRIKDCQNLNEIKISG